MSKKEWINYDVKITEKTAIAYKNREEGSAQKLLDLFDRFIEKYLDVISSGKVILDNNSIRKFISLFMNEKTYKKNVNRYLKTPSVLLHSYISISNIRSTFRIYSREDIKSMLGLALLELADNYKPVDEQPRFHFYVSKAYHFKVYHILVPITKDPLYYAMVNNEVFDERMFECYDDIDEGLFDNKYTELMTEQDNYVDDNWLMGFTDSEVFKECTTVDKTILKLYYADGWQDKEIGEHLGVCRATVNRRRLKIEKELSEKLIKLNLLNK